MLLAIDMGNTNIVIGCIQGNKTLFVERLCTDLSKTELEYAICFKTVLELYGIKEEDIVKEIKKYGKEAFHISNYNDIKLYLGQYVKEGDLILTLGAGYVTKLSDTLTSK